MSLIAPGVCRHCTCTEDDPCKLANGDECCWIDSTRTVCSGRDCLIAEDARKAAAKEAERSAKRKYGDRYKGWGPGAIFEDLRDRERAKRKKKGRAA
jgi:hypothetical protein